MGINKLDDDFRAWSDESEEGIPMFPASEKPRWEASRNIDEVSRLNLLREIAETHSFGWIDGLAVDALTGGWVYEIYRNLNEKNKAKYISMDFGVMVHIMYQLQERGTVKVGIG